MFVNGRKVCVLTPCYDRKLAENGCRFGRPGDSLLENVVKLSNQQSTIIMHQEIFHGQLKALLHEKKETNLILTKICTSLEKIGSSSQHQWRPAIDDNERLYQEVFVLLYKPLYFLFCSVYFLFLRAILSCSLFSSCLWSFCWWESRKELSISLVFIFLKRKQSQWRSASSERIKWLTDQSTRKTLSSCSWKS